MAYITWISLRIFLCTVICQIASYLGPASALTVSLSRKHQSNNYALTLVSFCNDCVDPQEDGSTTFGLQPRHGIKEFEVTGSLVYCVPNSAESRKVLNGHHFNNRIVLVDRGSVGLLDKVEKLANFDAVGIIIADDGRCKDDYSYCGPMAGSAKDGGYAINDDPHRWKYVDIPVILVSVRVADLLRLKMGIRKVNIPRIGMQNITVFHHGEDSYKDEL
jgi:hypothetical protein